jgi:hypothetical protein
MADKNFHRYGTKIKGSKIAGIEDCMATYPIETLPSSLTNQYGECTMHITNDPAEDGKKFSE